MALYSYVATDINGKLIRGKVKAENPQELYENLRENNLYCSSYEEVSEKQIKAKYKFKTKELALICRQLASMLTSGISVVKAIYILMSQAENAKAKDVMRDIYEEVQRGQTFSSALETKNGAFPNLFISMVASGEASGSLDTIMTRVANHYAKENKLNNTVKKAMIYPIILLVLMLGVVFALFGFIMPSFAGMFASQDEMPKLTSAIMGVSDVFKEKWYVIILVIVVFVVGVKLLFKIPAVRLQFDKFKCRAPKIGKLVTTVYLARFARTLANLFSSGLQMVECIEKSVEVLNNAYITACFDEVLEDIKRGESVSDSIARTGLFDTIFTSSLFIGEESGQLDEVLEKSADFYDEESESAIQRLVGMIEPVMIIFMGGLVMLVLAAVFPAMYSSFGGVA